MCWMGWCWQTDILLTRKTTCSRENIFHWRKRQMVYSIIAILYMLEIDGTPVDVLLSRQISTTMELSYGTSKSRMLPEKQHNGIYTDIEWYYSVDWVGWLLVKHYHNSLYSKLRRQLIHCCYNTLPSRQPIINLNEIGPWHAWTEQAWITHIRNICYGKTWFITALYIRLWKACECIGKILHQILVTSLCETNIEHLTCRNTRASEDKSPKYVTVF